MIITLMLLHNKIQYRQLQQIDSLSHLYLQVELVDAQRAYSLCMLFDLHLTICCVQLQINQNCCHTHHQSLAFCLKQCFLKLIGCQLICHTQCRCFSLLPRHTQSMLTICIACHSCVNQSHSCMSHVACHSCATQSYFCMSLTCHLVTLLLFQPVIN